MTATQPKLLTYFAVYALLMVGLAATVAAAYLPLGRWNLAAALAIAFGKASLVVLIFMHVRYSPPLTRLAVFAGLVWLAIFLALVLADYATRDWIPVTPVHSPLPEALIFEPPLSESGGLSQFWEGAKKQRSTWCASP